MDNNYDMEYRYKALWGENVLHYNGMANLFR